MIFTKNIHKVAITSLIGTFLDFYDYFVAASVAALVWTNLYFRFLSGPAAVGLAITTFLITFLTRPIGAYIFGHFGDRMGRKAMLVWTLILSGVSVLGISLTPSYASIGITAPILVILFRLIFGIGIGGEQGGAQSWISELADPNHRGFWSSIVNCGAGLGSAFSSLIVTASLLATGNGFFDWGWRIPFGIGFLAAVTGGFIRYRTLESPIFGKALENGSIEKAPATQVLKRYPKPVLLGSLYAMAVIGSAVIYSNGPYAIAFMRAVHASPLTITSVVAVSGLIGGIMNIISGAVSDMIGRKRVLLIQIVMILGMAFTSFLLMGTGNVGLILLSEVITGIASFMGGGVFFAFMCETISTEYRYSGIGLSYQIGGMLGGLVAGFILPPIIASVGVLNAWPYAAVIVVIVGILGLVGVIFQRESKIINLETV